MITTQHLAWRAVLALTVTTFLLGCASTPPIICEGRKLNIGIRCDPNINPSMKQDEINDRQRAAEKTVEKLADELEDAGCNVTKLSATDTFAPGRGRHLLSASIKDLHLVGDAAQFWLYPAAPPSWVDYHFDLSGDGKAPLLSYDYRDGSTLGWEESIRQTSKKTAKGVMTRLRAFYGVPVAAAHGR